MVRMHIDLADAKSLTRAAAWSKLTILSDPLLCGVLKSTRVSTMISEASWLLRNAWRNRWPSLLNILARDNSL